MKAYSITLPNSDRAFTFLTDEPPEAVADAIAERFRQVPVRVVAL